MLVQQIMRKGHDFLRMRGEGMFNLEPLGKSMCQKKTPKNVCPFPHAFTFYLPSHFLGGQDVFYHPSSMFSVYFLSFHA